MLRPSSAPSRSTDFDPSSPDEPRHPDLRRPVRILTAQQIEALHFRDHATTDGRPHPSTSPQRLTTAKLLVELDRQIGGGPRRLLVVHLPDRPLGYRVVHDHATMSGRVSEPSTTFLDHTLAVAQTAIDLTLAAAGMTDRPAEVLSIETEPSCWRTFQKGLGERDVEARPVRHVGTR